MRLLTSLLVACALVAAGPALAGKKNKAANNGGNGGQANNSNTVEKILTKAIIEDGKLAAEDIRHVIEAKIAVVEQDGLLEYYPVESTLENIADLRSLQAWLAKR